MVSLSIKSRVFIDYMIIIFSNKDDASTNEVINWLDFYSAKYIRFNSSDFFKTELKFVPTGGTSSMEVTHSPSARDLPNEDLSPATEKGPSHWEHPARGF